MQYLSKERSKELKKLQLKKYRDARNLVLVEGIRTIKQLVIFKIPLLEVYCSEKEIERFGDILGKIPSEKIFLTREYQVKKAAATETPQKIFALVEIKVPPLHNDQRLLYLDRVSDPGNLGTIFRLAVAAKMDGVILAPDSCDIFNPKVVRASMGAVFAIPSMISDHQSIERRTHQIIVTDVKEGTSIYDIEPPQRPYILVIGSEAEGIATELLNLADIRINIPMGGKLESLNVAVAAGFCMYALNRDLLSK